MKLPLENRPPEWRDYLGPDVMRDYLTLNEVYTKTVGQPLEERNNLLRIVTEDIITLRNRWRVAYRSERAEALAHCSKYNHPGTGLYAELIKEYETYLMDLEARFPSLVKWIKEIDEEYGPYMEYQQVKDFGGVNKPLVVYNHGPNLNPIAIGKKCIQDVKDHFIKKAMLLQEQNQILTRALEDNGIQIPQESAVIQARLDALKRPDPDEARAVQVEESGRETEEPRDPCPEARQVAFIEDHGGSEFTAAYVIQEELKKKPSPPPPPPPVELDQDELEEVFDAMHRFRSSKCFKTPITKEKSPKYFEMVREPRDLLIIKDRFRTVRWYLAEKFFNDIRLMLDNYSHVFGEGSEEHKMAERFQVAMFKKLDEYGEAGQTAKVCGCINI